MSDSLLDRLKKIPLTTIEADCDALFMKHTELMANTKIVGFTKSEDGWGVTITLQLTNVIPGVHDL